MRVERRRMTWSRKVLVKFASRNRLDWMLSSTRETERAARRPWCTKDVFSRAVSRRERREAVAPKSIDGLDPWPYEDMRDDEEKRNALSPLRCRSTSLVSSRRRSSPCTGRSARAASTPRTAHSESTSASLASTDPVPPRLRTTMHSCTTPSQATPSRSTSEGRSSRKHLATRTSRRSRSLRSERTSRTRSATPSPPPPSSTLPPAPLPSNSLPTHVLLPPEPLLTRHS